MDPWKIRSENDLGETLVIVHTDKGLNLLNNILSLRSEQKAYKEVALALDLKDIWRKQQLVPFFRGENCTETVLKKYIQAYLLSEMRCILEARRLFFMW